MLKNLSSDVKLDLIAKLSADMRASRTSNREIDL